MIKGKSTEIHHPVNTGDVDSPTEHFHSAAANQIKMSCHDGHTMQFLNK